jgi:hypothetical protein
MPRTSRPRKGSTPKARSTSSAGKAPAAAPKKPRVKRAAASVPAVTAEPPVPVVAVVEPGAVVGTALRTEAGAGVPPMPPTGHVSVELPSEALPVATRIPAASVDAPSADDRLAAPEAPRRAESQAPAAEAEATPADARLAAPAAPRTAEPRAPTAGRSRVAANGGTGAAHAPAGMDPRKEAEEARPLPAAGTEPSPTRAASVEVEDGPQYLYGVVRAVGDLDFGLIGLGAPPADVRSVREGNLAALVSAAPAMVVDPTRAHLLVHQRVTEAVLREHTLLPVAFGTVLRSEAEVRSLLRTAQDALTGALTALEGTVELGLKVLYHREHLARRLELEDPVLGRREGEPEADHERRMGVALEARVEQDMGSLLEGLRPLAKASRTGPPVGDRMLLNAAFLVARDAVPAFEAKVKTLAARSDIYAFRFTGPWAPYSFVDIRLGLEPEPDAAA